jgi:glycyl-tRNA synthetase
VEKLTAALAPALGLDDAQARIAVRAAHLAKADLATQMVVEMTSLQGILGRYYAIDSGEPPEVAQAIEEHYHPRSADDSLPASLPGAAVALADRLDSLAGLFAAGLAPTGARDPFALRRAAIGALQILLGQSRPFDLRAGLRRAAALQPVAVSEEILSQIMDFLSGRLRGVLTDLGFRYDVVEAVLGARAYDPTRARSAAEDLARWVARPDWPQVLAAYARCVRITRDVKGTNPVDPARLEAPEEKALFAAAEEMAAKVTAARSTGAASIDLVMGELSGHVEIISGFFEKILVMAEDPAVRANRLGILQIISALPNGIADLSKIEGF